MFEIVAEQVARDSRRSGHGDDNDHGQSEDANADQMRTGTLRLDDQIEPGKNRFSLTIGISETWDKKVPSNANKEIGTSEGHPGQDLQGIIKPREAPRHSAAIGFRLDPHGH